MKDDVMIKTISFLSLISLFFILSTAPIYPASECEYGAVHAWFRTSDDPWENATAHPLLRRGESFEIKISITIKKALQVFYLKLHEFGEPVYEVIEGPTAMEQLLEIRKPTLCNQSLTYLWKMRVRVNTSWVNGYGPLEVYVQFNRNDVNESWVNFDVMTAYIVDELWMKYLQQTQTDTGSSQQGYLLWISRVNIISIILLQFFVRIFFQVQRQNHGLSRIYRGR